MITEKLYERDSYLQEFDATVLSCAPQGENYGVVLDRTAFFCEGGGQYGDEGAIRCGEDWVAVLDTVPQGGEVTHITDGPLPVGASVHGIVHFETRYRNMQNHSGEHVVSGIIHARHGFDNVGFHLGRDYVSLDISGPLTPSEVARIEELANEVVWRNLPITVSFPTAEELAALRYRSKKDLSGEVRIVTVGDCDACACCAPHVRRTGEIGMIKLLNPINYKGGTRMFLQCGSSALADYNEKQSRIEAISHLLSAKQTDVVQAVERVKSELGEARQEIAALRRALAGERLAALNSNGGVALFFEEMLDVSSLRILVNGAVERTGGMAAAFLGNDTDGYLYMIASREMPMRPVAAALREAFGAKGGGSDAMIQGNVTADRAALTAWVNGYFKEEKA